MTKECNSYIEVLWPQTHLEIRIKLMAKGWNTYVRGYCETNSVNKFNRWNVPNNSLLTNLKFNTHNNCPSQPFYYRMNANYFDFLKAKHLLYNRCLWIKLRLLRKDCQILAVKVDKYLRNNRKMLIKLPTIYRKAISLKRIKPTRTFSLMFCLT